MKQKDLAARLELSPSHLSEIEKGVKPVSYDLLCRYSEIFELPVSSIALFAEVVDGAKPKKSLKAALADKALRVLEWMDAISRFQDDEPKQHSKAKAH